MHPSRRTMTRAMVASTMLVAALAVACRQADEETGLPPAGAVLATPAPGRVWIQPGPPVVHAVVRNPYAGDDAAIEDGERLYGAMNCGGCHGGTGGAIGPNLQDSTWIYGGDAASIYESIMNGRPGGMPTWRGRLPDETVWKIVAYLQSLGPQSGQQVQQQGRQEGG